MCTMPREVCLLSFNFPQEKKILFKNKNKSSCINIMYMFVCCVAMLEINSHVHSMRYMLLTQVYQPAPAFYNLS